MRVERVKILQAWLNAAQLTGETRAVYRDEMFGEILSEDKPTKEVKK